MRFCAAGLQTPEEFHVWFVVYARGAKFKQRYDISISRAHRILESVKFAVHANHGAWFLPTIPKSPT